MKLVILSDAHGNRIYFDTVIRQLEKINADMIICLGDIFGYFPDGRYVMECLRGMGAKLLKGNHEAMLLGELPLDYDKDALYKLRQEKEQINPQDKEFLANLDSSFILSADSKRLLFVHGSPMDTVNGYLYEDDRKYDWNEPDFDYVFMGHTHRPFVKKVRNTTFVNVGSCGLPRDIGLSPSYCVFDSVSEDIRIERIQLDKEIFTNVYYANTDIRILDVMRRTV
ncbi:MAG: metallophosphoesterase family protein [Lachnospiraceae bacterium]|nr:metallophosphoesterase family protein [Lachnospiraceae bacterium]